MASPKVEDSGRQLKRLPGWLAAPVAAERAGLSRQWVFDMINSGALDAYEIGGTGKRPACIIVRESTLNKLIAERAARLGCPKCREAGTKPAECTHQAPAEAREDPEIAALLGV